MLTMLVTSNHRVDSDTAEWELTPVLKPILENMNGFLEGKSEATLFARCDASVLKLEGSGEAQVAPFINERIGINGTDVPAVTAKTESSKSSKLKQQFMKALVLSAPCG
jgi:hypothetical protein